MKKAIILHGMPSQAEYYDPINSSQSNSHWLPWLQQQLIIRNIKTDTPEIPLSYKPQWVKWVREVERFELDKDTALIGHSAGAGFWVRYLSDHPTLAVGKVVLVAPWLDPDGDETDGFFDFTIDPELVSRTNGVIIFNSDNDMGNVHKSVAKLRKQIRDIKYREFHKAGHFCEADIGREFPELLDEVVNGED